MPSATSCEEILANLVHDLRQPLGNIETGVFYLDMVLDHPQGRVREQLVAMERQVAESARLLHFAAEEVRRLRSQRAAGAGESAAATASLDLTKPATSAVA
jgi:signal transduction histidine kinase